MSFAAFESKIEDMAHAMLDHAEITKSLKEKVAEGEAKVEDAVRSVEEKIAAAKDEILGEVHKIVDDFRSEIFGDFDKVKTDTVEKAKDAVAALKTDGDDAGSSVSAAPAAPVETSADATAETSAPAAAPSEGSASAASPVVAQTPSGAITTVDATVGATVHESGEGVVTTVPHDGSEPTAINSIGQSVQPTPEAVQEAVQASAEAGVTVSAPAPVAL